MPFPADAILQAYEQGIAVALVTGRSLRDLCLDEDGKIRPILEVLRRRLLQRYRMVLVTYSMAEGLQWSRQGLGEPERQAVEGALRSNALLDGLRHDSELVRVVRGIASVARGAGDSQRPAGDRPVRFCFLLEFGEHLAPASMAGATVPTDQQLVIAELVHLLAYSLSVRNSGNLVLLTAREGMVDELVTRAAHRIRLPQPGPEEKQAFVEALLRLYTEARLQEGLTPHVIAHLTANTPNRLVEAAFRASHRTGQELSAQALTRYKAEAVEELSEGTLTLLGTQRVEGVELVGVNIRKPLEILRSFSHGLARGDRATPLAVLLVGPPGVGKTDLATLAARDAGLPAFQMHSPKAPYVGMTESRARLQQTLLEEWAPNIAFVDEVTEALPLQRPELDTDSGASRAVTATLLTALSDESRRGRTLLVGTTNCPWRMSAAMRSRWRCIPVLFPLPEDFPSIVSRIAALVDPECGLSPEDPEVQEAASIFYRKHAGPREIRKALADLRLRRGGLDARGALEAARTLIPSVDVLSVVYADLWALRATEFYSDLPWFPDPKGYPFPEHLRPLVSPETGEVDLNRLEDELRRLAPHARV
jgi:Arc/MetJ family transcription regulator